MTRGLPTPAGAASQQSDCDLHAVRVRLVGLAVKFVWNRDDAEEIVQEAFRLALERGPGVGDPRMFPWMVRTVSNLCMNERRRRTPQPLPESIGTSAVSTPAKLAHDREALERVRRAIDRLPEQQRVALVLRTMEQMEYSDIGEAMNLTESAVRTHVHLARQALLRLEEMR